MNTIAQIKYAAMLGEKTGLICKLKANASDFV